jgi:delta24(24(1))-sterol reductase
MFIMVGKFLTLVITSYSHCLNHFSSTEFGGPFGVTILMLVFPCLMYYLTHCLLDHQGALLLPWSWTADGSVIWSGLVPVAFSVWDSVRYSHEGLLYYSIFCVFQALLAALLPGPIIDGFPIPSLNFMKLQCTCGISFAFASDCHRQESSKCLNFFMLYDQTYAMA